MLSRFRNCELEPEEQDVVAKVEKHGWMTMNVKDEPGKTGWSYTIGLFETFDHPEVIVFGMEAENRHRILNWIGENVRNGTPLTADQEHDWVLQGYKCWSRPVEKRWYRDLIGWAQWFYSSADNIDSFPCVQVLWPARGGEYPWEETAPGACAQPFLYEKDLIPARMMHYATAAELSQEEWPFPCDPHAVTYVSRCVVEDGASIVRVVHDHDGDWQFIGPVEDPNLDGCRILCFHCVVERDPGIKALAGLPAGVRALREDPSKEWVWEEIKAVDEGS